MKRYLIAIVILFVIQLFLIHACHFDGRWFLMDLANAVESDRGLKESQYF